MLHNLVIKHMLHGPCGALNRKCPCMINGECRFHYPWQFNPETQGKDSYPLYRRRDDGQHVKIRGAKLDNKWVVPCNPGLLMRYNYHINVEACSSIKACKYLFKYVYKGHDCASFSVVDAGVMMRFVSIGMLDTSHRRKLYKGFSVSIFLGYTHLFCCSNVICQTCSLLLLMRQRI